MGTNLADLPHRRQSLGRNARKLPFSMGNSDNFFPMQNEAARAAGQSIRAVRELAGLTLGQAAKLTGKSPGYLSQVETGNAANVSEKYVANVVGALAKYIADPVADKVTELAEADAA